MERVVGTGTALVVIVVITLAIASAARLERPGLQPWAILRAVVQLGLLSLVLVGVVQSVPLTAVLMLVGLLVATWTAAGRIGLARQQIPLLLALLTAAVALPVVVVLVAGALPATPRYLLAIGGILIGNAMTAASLTGRTLRASLATHRDEVEAWLAIGASPRRAAARLVRAAASTAVLPATDQARTTGLVALPGAFVGALFGGASVADAARFQVLVLASILLVGVIVAVGLGAALGAPRTLPVDEVGPRR